MLRRFRETDSDSTDAYETHVFDSLQHVDGGGSVIKVRGNGTVDEDVIVIAGVSGFNPAKGADSEIDIFAGSNDTHKKRAIMNIPHTSQRKWAEDSGGIQSPSNGDRALEINKKRTYSTDAAFALLNGIFEMVDGKIYIRGDVLIKGTLGVAGVITSPNVPDTPIPAGGSAVDVPDFSE